MLPLQSLAEFKFGPVAFEYPNIILAQVLGLVALLCFLWFVNLPYVSKTYWVQLLSERETKIATNKQQVDEAKAEVTKLRDDYKNRISQIESEAKTRIDAAVREAEAAKLDIISDAQQTALAIKRRSEEEIDRERTKQRILLRQQLVQMTLDAAENSVKAHADSTVQRRLISDFTASASSVTSGATAKPGGVS